jgi:hypothetical protein
MPDRLRHALRFAVTTVVAVYAIGVGWEAVEAFVLGDVALGLTAWQTFGFNEGVWRTIAVVAGATVFLLRVGDLHDRPPTWRFAWELAAWLGIAAVLVTSALEAGRWTLAAALAAVGVAAWLWLHRRLAGWPGAPGGVAGADAERELP